MLDPGGTLAPVVTVDHAALAAVIGTLQQQVRDFELAAGQLPVSQNAMLGGAGQFASTIGAGAGAYVSTWNAVLTAYQRSLLACHRNMGQMSLDLQQVDLEAGRVVL
jgi:hypothetical protein